MPSPADPDWACREISGDLTDLARWLSEGDLTPDEFRSLVITSCVSPTIIAVAIGDTKS